MKKTLVITSICAVSLMALGLLSFDKSKYTAIENNIISIARFNTWINGATITSSVFVEPADGINFIGDNSLNEENFDRQDFFRWSQQMFLWILSPVPSNGSYGVCKGLVMNSPAFYDYDVTQSVYKRHKCIGDSQKMSFDVKSTQNGIHNLPLFFEKDTDKVFDVDKTPLSKDGFQLVYDAKKNIVEVGKLKVVKTKVIFFDRNGKVIEKANLIFTKDLNANTTIQQFTYNNNTISISIDSDFEPLVILSSVAQANNNKVLMNRQGSLVYYNIMVNDVYVAFYKMFKQQVVPNNSLFPTTLSDETSAYGQSKVGMQHITEYGAENGIPLIDTGNRALAMELKTSWVEVTPNLPRPESYITQKVIIPNYIPSTVAGTYIKSGTRRTTLALVGMHVVGSVKGHPEMIWSTFEHVNNTLNNFSNFTVPAGTNDFIFFNPAAPLPTANVAHIQGFNTLTGANGFTISPSNTVRNMPFGWGGVTGQSAINPVDILSIGASNAQLSLLYEDVRNRLLINDVRRNYFQVGSTWNSLFREGEQAGTVRLSNATMETYTQATSNNITNTAGAGLNCFSCHDTGLQSSFSSTPYVLPAPGTRFLSHNFLNTNLILP